MPISVKGEKPTRKQESFNRFSSLVRRLDPARALLSRVLSEIMRRQIVLGGAIGLDNEVELLDTETTTSARAIRVNGTHYVSNLFWQPLSLIADAHKDAKAFLLQRNMNLYSLNQASALQGGYAKVSLAYKQIYSGSFSLATSMARAISNRGGPATWLAVLKVDDRFAALVACDDGQIIPGMDVIDTVEKITKKIAENDGFNWGRVYTNVPAISDLYGQYAIESVSIDSLLSFKPDKATRAVLELDRRRELLMISSAILLIGAAVVYGNHLYEEHKQAVLLEVQRFQNSQLLEQRKLDSIAKARQALEPYVAHATWEEKPPLLQWLSACQDAIEAMPLLVATWAIEDAVCRGAELVARYKRAADSTSSDFAIDSKKLVALGLTSTFVVEDNMGTLTTDLRTDHMGSRGSVDLLNPEDWRIPFVSNLQLIGAKYEYSAKSASSAKPPSWIVESLGAEEILKTEQWWTTYGWSFSLIGLSSIEMLQSMGDVPGLVVDRITVSMTGSSRDRWEWSAAGEANVKRPTVK